jgi:hypothetical protein
LTATKFPGERFGRASFASPTCRTDRRSNLPKLEVIRLARKRGRGKAARGDHRSHPTGRGRP